MIESAHVVKITEGHVSITYYKPGDNFRFLNNKNESFTPTQLAAYIAALGPAASAEYYRLQSHRLELIPNDNYTV